VVLVAGGRLQHRARALDQQISQVGVAALADMPEAGLAASGMLARHQADPGGELTAVLELSRVANCGDNRQGGGGADAADLHEPARRLGEPRLGFDLPVVGADARIEQVQLLEQIHDRAPCELG
jgi:hypothetical protein